MKRSTSWFLVLTASVMVLAFAACGGDSDDEGDEGTGTTPAAVATAAEPTEPEPDDTQGAAAESFADFDADMQARVDGLCTSASAATGESQTWALPGTAQGLLAGSFGTTLAQHGEDLKTAFEKEDTLLLSHIARDIVFSCEEIGWTPS